MTRQISDRQAAIILSIAIVSLKFLILPALFSRYSLHNSYWSVLIGLVIDFIFLLIILFILNKFPHLTFTEILNRGIGNIGRRAINLIMFVYFFVKGILIIKETHNYFNETMFENISWLSFIFPFFILIFFMMLKDLKTIARSVEFFFLIILAGVILTILSPIKTVDLSNLLPLFDNGNILKGLFHCNFSFGDYFILMLMMGRIDIKKGSIKKIIKYVVGIDFLVVCFFIIFTAIFGSIGSNQILAVSDIPLHADVSSTIGRLDWIIIIVWTITLIFQAGIIFSMSCHCLNDTITFKNKYLPASIIIGCMTLAVLFLYLDLGKSIEIVTSMAFAIISIIIQVLVPIILLVCTIKLKNNNKINYLQIIKHGQIKIQYTDILPSKQINLKFNLSKTKEIKPLKQRGKVNA